MRDDKGITPVSLSVGDVLTLQGAARVAGVSTDTVRRWALKHGIGRQRSIASTWVISGTALRMVVAVDMEALEAFRNREFDSPLVAPYLPKVGADEGVAA